MRVHNIIKALLEQNETYCVLLGQSSASINISFLCKINVSTSIISAIRKEYITPVTMSFDIKSRRFLKHMDNSSSKAVCCFASQNQSN